MIKRIISIVLILSTFFSVNMVSYAEDNSSQICEKMMQYISSQEDDDIIDRDNYAYIAYAENFLSNKFASGTMELIHKFINSGSIYNIEPEYYAKILISVMALSENDNASSTAEQKKHDNLKTINDYAIDFAQMASNAISIYIGTSNNLAPLSEDIALAIDGISTVVDGTENCAEAYSNLETVLQNYDKFHIFLTAIAEHSEGNLQLSALTLRNGISRAMEHKLNSYINIVNTNSELFSEFFFSNVFIDLLKELPEYANDENLKFFVDSSSDVFSAAEALAASWELGAGIGTLFGNLTVGGEDLMGRMREMVVLDQIRQALVPAITATATDFLTSYSSNVSEKSVSYIYKYTDLAHFLKVCDLRGEFCLASIVSSDAKLLTWFNKENIDNAEKWYSTRIDGIKIAHSKLQSITINRQENVNMDISPNVTFSHYRDSEPEYALIEAVDMNGNLLWQYRTADYPLVQLPLVFEIGIFDGKYFFKEGNSIFALDLITGEILWENSDFSGSALFDGCRYIDNDGVIYLCGYYGPEFFAVNSEGITLCKIQSFSDKYHWPYEMEKISDNIMAVKFQNGPNGPSNDGSYVVYVNLSDFSYSFEIASKEPDKVTTSYTDYNEVIEIYAINSENGWGDDSTYSYGLLNNSDMSSVSYLLRQIKSPCGYCIMDIDRNGSQELLISTQEYALQGMILDMYTMADGKIIHLFSGGERDRFYLTSDGNILNESSGGAQLWSNTIYKINPLTGLLDTNYVALYDAWENASNPWFYAEDTYYDIESYEYYYDVLQPITEDQYNTLIMSLPSKQSFELNILANASTQK